MPIITGQGGGGGGGGATAIKSLVLTVAGTTIDVTGIPATYKSLLILYGAIQSTRSAASDTMNITLNGDSGASHYGMNAGGGNATGGFSTSFAVRVPATAAGVTQAGAGTIWIPDYTNATPAITCIGETGGRCGNAGTAADFNNPAEWNGIWSGGAAVSEITFTLVTGPNFAAGAFVNVYGYK